MMVWGLNPHEPTKPTAKTNILAVAMVIWQIMMTHSVWLGGYHLLNSQKCIKIILLGWPNLNLVLTPLTHVSLFFLVKFKIKQIFII